MRFFTIRHSPKHYNVKVKAGDSDDYAHVYADIRRIAADWDDAGWRAKIRMTKTDETIQYVGGIWNTLGEAIDECEQVMRIDYLLDGDAIREAGRRSDIGKEVIRS